MAKKKAVTGRVRKAARVSTKTQMFFGSMKWFDVDLEGLPRSMPKAFAAARALHKEHGHVSAARVIRLLQPFAHAVFMPHTLPDWERFFADPDGEGMPETPARSVRLYGVDFENAPKGPFPLARMAADFEVPVLASFRATEFDRWKEESDVQLYDAVSFMWKIPSVDPREDPTCFPWLNHMGAECMRCSARAAPIPKDLGG
jgi:hypothetical protein